MNCHFSSFVLHATTTVWWRESFPVSHLLSNQVKLSSSEPSMTDHATDSHCVCITYWVLPNVVYRALYLCGSWSKYVQWDFFHYWWITPLFITYEKLLNSIILYYVILMLGLFREGDFLLQFLYGSCAGFLVPTLNEGC